jgi:transcriptional regulator with XRE-family HTH domain
MSEDGSTLARRQLGKYLRNGRQERGLSLHEAAKLIQRSGSTLHRMEKGQVGELREIDIDALCTIYEFDADHTAAMKALAVQGNELGWWYEYADLLPRNFDFYVGLEASARRLTTYEPELVPGLLQTPAYASVLIRSVYPDDDAEEWGSPGAPHGEPLGREAVQEQSQRCPLELRRSSLPPEQPCRRSRFEEPIRPRTGVHLGRMVGLHRRNDSRRVRPLTGLPISWRVGRLRGGVVLLTVRRTWHFATR